jgi:hypothetical protein
VLKPEVARRPMTAYPARSNWPEASRLPLMVARVQTVRINPPVIRIRLRQEQPTPFRWIKVTTPQVIRHKAETLEGVLQVKTKLAVLIVIVRPMPIRLVILQPELMQAGPEAVRGTSTVSSTIKPGAEWARLRAKGS